MKVNCLVMRYLHFESVRGDLQEGNGCASRCQLSLFPVPIPVSPSTKSGFLCFIGLRRPYFLAFRAQNRGFCALLMWNGAQVLAVTIAVAVALTVTKVLALTTILAADLAADLAEDLAAELAVDMAEDLAAGLALDLAEDLA